MPKFEIQTIEDAYTYYVTMLGLSEELFWRADLSTVATVAANKAAYDGWVSSEKEKAAEKARQKSQHRRR